MADFSIREVAFTGFRVVRERPMVIVIWAMILLIVAVTAASLLVGLAGPEFMRLQALGAQASMDPRIARALLPRLAAPYVLILPLGLVTFALFLAAMNRAVFEPDDDQFGYFRLGGDELRQLGLVLVLALIVMAATAFCLVAAVVVAMGLSAGAPPNLRVSVRVFQFLELAVLAFLAVRLSLAPARTFATRRIDLLSSWKMTRGRFWPLFAAYGLALLLALVIWFLFVLIILAAIGIVSGENPLNLDMRPNLASLGAYFTKASLAQIVLSAIGGALIWPVLGTPAAAVHQQLASAEAR